VAAIVMGVILHHQQTSALYAKSARREGTRRTGAGIILKRTTTLKKELSRQQLVPNMAMATGTPTPVPQITS
jgi:hypothetical protein